MSDWRVPLAEIPPRSSLRYSGPYTAAWLDQWRQVMDPPADAVVEAMRLNGKPKPDMLADVRERAASEGGVFQAFLDEAAQVPEWVDFDKLEAGQRLITRYTPYYGLALLTGSLVGGAIFIKQALITASTGRLSTKGASNQRIVETAAMVKAMALEGELRPGKRAHDTILRVRLLHSAIRFWLRETGRLQPEWDQPICQEDLAITLSLFSYVNIRSLLRLGVKLTREEVDSHHHLWRYAGHVLGIREELLTANVEQEQQLWNAYLVHTAYPELVTPQVKQVLDSVADTAPVARPFVRNYLYAMTRYLAGDDWVVGMDLPALPNYPGVPVSRVLGRMTSILFALPGIGAAWHQFVSIRLDHELREMSSKRGMDYDVKIVREDDSTMMQTIRKISGQLADAMRRRAA